MTKNMNIEQVPKESTKVNEHTLQLHDPGYEGKLEFGPEKNSQ